VRHLLGPSSGVRPEDALDQRDIDELEDEVQYAEPAELNPVQRNLPGARRTWKEIAKALVDRGVEPKLLCGQTVRDTHDKAIAKIKFRLDSEEFDEFLSYLREMEPAKCAEYL
jgi:hypothetical protein